MKSTDGNADLTPIDYLLSVMRDPAADPERRFWAAELLLPYMHVRLSPEDDEDDD
jgi:hypothetical protein